MAHIQKRGPRKWKARYRAPDGKERSRIFERRVDAEQWLAAAETKKAEGTWVDPRLSKVPFADWVDLWWPATAALKPKTRAGYESLLRSLLLPAFGTTQLGRLEPLHVHRWIAALQARGLSPSRIRQAYGLLAMMMKAAVQSGYIGRSPCVGVKLPRAPRREMHVLNPEQVRALVESIAEPYGVLVYVLAFGGLRWGEACAIRRSRCDLLRNRIEVAESLAEVGGNLHFGEPKSYQHRWVRLPRFVGAALAEHLERNVAPPADALVFTSPTGAPLRYTNFRRRQWQPALRGAGIDLKLTPHQLRDFFASFLHDRGASVKAIQEQLGHSSPTVTLSVYTHLFQGEMDRLYDDVEEPLAASPRPTTLSALASLPDK